MNETNNTCSENLHKPQDFINYLLLAPLLLSFLLCHLKL